MVLQGMEVSETISSVPLLKCSEKSLYYATKHGYKHSFMHSRVTRVFALLFE